MLIVFCKKWLIFLEIFVYMNFFVSLDKGRKKQLYTTDSDEISHIVNRIAPQVNIGNFIVYFRTVKQMAVSFVCSSFMWKIFCLIRFSSPETEQHRLLLPFLQLKCMFWKKEHNVKLGTYIFLSICFIF